MNEPDKQPREWWVRVNNCARITSGFMTKENPYDGDGFQWVEKSEGDQIIKVREVIGEKPIAHSPVRSTWE